MMTPIIPPAALLERAEFHLLDSTPLDAMLAGFLSRAALETDLRLKARGMPLRRSGLHVACRWIVPLVEGGMIDSGELRRLNRLFDRLAALVHNNQCCPLRARVLFDRVQDIILER